MKKKSLILLPMLLLGSVGAVTSCKEKKVQVTEAKVTSVAFKDAPTSMYVGVSEDLSEYVKVSGEGDFKKDVEWSVDKPEVLEVSEDGAATAKSAGTAVVTIKSTADATKTATLTIAVSVKSLPTPVAKTVGELAKMTKTDTQNLYEVYGLVSGIVDSVYGNYTLNSLDGKDKIEVYGSTLSSSSLKWDGSCANIEFKNPQDFKTKLDGDAKSFKDSLKEGYAVTLICTFEYYGSGASAKPEIHGYVKGGLSGIKTSAELGPIFNITDNFATDEGSSVKHVKKVEDAWVEDAEFKATERSSGEDFYLQIAAPAGKTPIVKVNGGQRLDPVEDGIYKCTVTGNTTVDVSFVQVPALPEYTVRTPAQLVAYGADTTKFPADKGVYDDKNLYQVTGIVSDLAETNASGSFKLHDIADYSKALTVYGATDKESSIDWTKSNDKFEDVAFTNPKDFVSSGLNAKIHNGDHVTMYCQFEGYKGTPEIMGFIKEAEIDLSSNHADFNADVQVTKVNEQGAATLSKTTGIYVGEEVEVVVTDVEGYTPVVKLNGKEIDVNGAGKYVFKADRTNLVTVEYAAEVAPTGNVVLDLVNIVNSTTGYEDKPAMKVNGITFDASWAGILEIGNADDGVGNKQKYYTLCGRSSTHPLEYMEISSKFAFNGVEIEGIDWAANDKSLTLSFEYWDAAANDGAGAWVADAAAAHVATGGTKVLATIKTESEFSTTKVRVKYVTADDSNLRFGIKSITVKFPAAA